jgi:hypothetical protein
MKRVNKLIKRLLCLTVTVAMVLSVFSAGVTAAAIPGWEALSTGAQDLKGFQNITGFEWNAPFNGRAHVGMVGNTDTVRRELAILSYMHDGAREPTLMANDATTPSWIASLRPSDQMMQNPDADARAETPLVPDFRVHQLNQMAHDSLGAVNGLQKNFTNSSFVIPRIVADKTSSQWGWAAYDLKSFNDTSADVFFGAEFMPKTVTTMPDRLIIIDPFVSIDPIPADLPTEERDLRAFRAHDSRVNIVNRPGTTVDAKVAAYIAEQVAIQQAIIDNADASAEAKTVAAALITSYQADTSMLTFARSQVTYGGASYYAARVGGVWDTLLTEGRRFWLFGEESNIIGSDKLAGMKSGNSFVSQGNLVTFLNFAINNSKGSAIMGQTLNPIKGQATQVSISFQGNGVDHIDLIGGEIKSVPPRQNPSPTITYHPLHRLTDEYKAETVSTTNVIKRFDKSEFTAGANGMQTVTFTLPATDKDMYYRLRGTNNTVAAAGYDANNTPKADTGTNDGLWFYSNPIFVGTQINDGVTLNSKLTSGGNALANRKIELVSAGLPTVTTTSDANGNFKFHNIPIDALTLRVMSVSGTSVEFSKDFFLQRWENTGFEDDFAWIMNGIFEIDMNFDVNGSNMSILSVSDGSPPPAEEEPTDVNENTPPENNEVNEGENENESESENELENESEPEDYEPTFSESEGNPPTGISMFLAITLVVLSLSFCVIAGLSKNFRKKENK